MAYTYIYASKYQLITGTDIPSPVYDMLSKHHLRWAPKYLIQSIKFLSSVSSMLSMWQICMLNPRLCPNSHPMRANKFVWTTIPSFSHFSFTEPNESSELTVSYQTKLAPSRPMTTLHFIAAVSAHTWEIIACILSFTINRLYIERHLLLRTALMPTISCYQTFSYHRVVSTARSVSERSSPGDAST